MSRVGKLLRAIDPTGPISFGRWSGWRLAAPVLAVGLLGCPANSVLPITPTIDPMADEHPEGCVLERWEDGDTAVVDCGSGTPELVRLFGIDAAETGVDDESRERARLQAKLWKLPEDAVLRCGKAAAARVLEICPAGSEVVLHGDQTDDEDRLLAHIHCAGKHVNQRLIEEGHAGRYPHPKDPARPRLCR